MFSRFSVPMAVGLAALLLLPGCSGGGSSSSRGATATMEVRLTDAPIDSGIQSVMVTLTGVTVYPDETMDAMDPMHADGPPPIHLMSFPQTFDLLTLTGGATALLASGEVPVGTYARIRLEISSASLIDAATPGTPVPLKCESNKVDVPIRFHVTAGQTSTLVLDFDAGASVQVNLTASGESILRPVVTPVP